MTEGLEAVTAAALGLALDAAELRQQAAAANIANASTDGYVPVRVSFEEQLGEARGALLARGRLDTTSLADVTPTLEPAPLGASGLPPKVMLDLEVAGMSQNAAHYAALLKAVSRHYAVLGLAATEGKR